MECCGAKFFHGQERMILLSYSADVNVAFQSILLFGEKGVSFSSIACHHSISLADIGAMDSYNMLIHNRYTPHQICFRVDNQTSEVLWYPSSLETSFLENQLVEFCFSTICFWT